MRKGTVGLTALSESQRILANQRFQLIQPYLADELSLTAIARQRGIPLRTLQRWINYYYEAG